MKWIFTLAALIILVSCSTSVSEPITDVNGPSDEQTFSECEEPRPDFCTKEYRPVCGTVDTGIRCITMPCPSSIEQTFGNACDACSNQNVSGYVQGECNISTKPTYVVCRPTTTGFDAKEFAANINGTCIDTCPSGFDEYVTQIGIPMCIEHYGEAEIKNWPTCTRSSQNCQCVRTTETTSGKQIEDAQYRCVPEQYASRLLFRSGQDYLDENGQSSVIIA